MDPLIGVAIGVVALLLGVGVDRFLLSRLGTSTLERARLEADRLLAEAQRNIERQQHEKIDKVEVSLTQREADLARETTEAKRAIKRSREKLDARQEKLNRRTKRINERETILQKGTKALTALRDEARQQHQEAVTLYERADRLFNEAEMRAAQASIHAQATEEVRTQLTEEREAIQKLREEQLRRLEQITSLSAHDAKAMLLEQFYDEAKLEAASHVKEIRDEAKLKAARMGRKVILTAIQRTAASHAIENTVSVVNIQSDEMKGRIIGREGRNIRAFEAATGIEVIVDDTPEAVILSGFNPVRREIARIALNRLILDGRIHPARIEEVVEKARQDVEEEIVETGERAVIDLNLHGIHPELIRHVGRMRYRTSYGQNLLAHSIETARIASLMAAELGLDATKARRAGLLHDIGKVIDEELESPHAIVGMELCQKFKEDDEVCNAVGAHHDEIEMTSLISPLVQAADAISGARPGARREALEAYIKRLEKLEDLAASFSGVERVYAIQAGREIRVLVNHDLISDAEAEQLAIDISKKIQRDMQYPGQIKVTVIREVRSVSYAK